MKTFVITGTDKGLGLSLAETALRAGNRVFATGLKPEGDGSRALVERYPTRVKVLPLDLASGDSIRRAASIIRSNTSNVDRLVNNAGVLGDIEYTIGDPNLDFDEISKVIRINAVGTLRVIHELWDLVVLSDDRLIVNISSEGGSIGQNWRDRWFGYCMSKAALNMAGALVHARLRELGGRVMQVHPGYLKSYMHGFKNEDATYEPDEAAELILTEIERRVSRECGERPEFFDLHGEELQW